jgi:hypothetical protein
VLFLFSLYWLVTGDALLIPVIARRISAGRFIGNILSISALPPLSAIKKYARLL